MYRNDFGITSFFVWLTFECWGQLPQVDCAIFMKWPTPTKLLVTCMQLLIIATTGVFNNCVLSSSLMFSFNSKRLGSPGFLLEFKAYSSNISTLVILFLVKLWQHSYLFKNYISACCCYRSQDLMFSKTTVKVIFSFR